MSSQIAPDVSGPQEPGHLAQPPLNKREAKAQAAAAKAYSKSQRGWVARHKIITALGALVALIVVIAVAASGSKSTVAPAPGASSSKAAVVPGAHIGTAVRDGKFEFTVTAVDPGKSTLGTGPLLMKAQGVFVVVHLTVANSGTESQLFDQSSQVMFDQNGNKLSPDTSASIAVDSNNFLAQINPGNRIKGLLVFDVAKNAVPTTMELHDSAFSNGISVSLK